MNTLNRFLPIAFLFFALTVGFNHTTIAAAQPPKTVETAEPQPTDNEKPTELKILTWNIFMLPYFLGNHGQIPRTPYVVEALRNEYYDVIVLQEVFIKKIEKQICEALLTDYPYQVKPPKKRFLFQQNSGVVILSRYPIKMEKWVVYPRGMSYDYFSYKGAHLIEVEKKGFSFQIIGTHAQAVENEKAQKIRYQQYELIKTQLLEPNKREGVPQFVVGDMNSEKEIAERYQTMLSILEAKDCCDGFCVAPTWNGNLVDFRTPKTVGWKAVLDYILHRENGRKIKTTSVRVRQFKAKWKKNMDDLSDHYAVEASIVVE